MTNYDRERIFTFVCVCWSGVLLAVFVFAIFDIMKTQPTTVTATTELDSNIVYFVKNGKANITVPVYWELLEHYENVAKYKVSENCYRDLIAFNDIVYTSSSEGCND